jgi:hypothetical protein
LIGARATRGPFSDVQARPLSGASGFITQLRILQISGNNRTQELKANLVSDQVVMGQLRGGGVVDCVGHTRPRAVRMPTAWMTEADQET